MGEPIRSGYGGYRRSTVEFEPWRLVSFIGWVVAALSTVGTFAVGIGAAGEDGVKFYEWCWLVAIPLNGVALGGITAAVAVLLRGSTLRSELSAELSVARSVLAPVAAAPEAGASTARPPGRLIEVSNVCALAEHELCDLARCECRCHGR